MIRTIGLMCLAMVVGLFCSDIDNGAAAQDVPPGAKPVSPSPIKQTYDPLQAGRDAYRAAEEERRRAIRQQLDAMDYAQWHGTWIAPLAYSYPLPGAYAYPLRRSVRRAYRGVYVGGVVPVITPWPRVSVSVYGSPYYARVRQPIGHEKIWTGPNGYVYRPIYAAPPAPVAAEVPAPVTVEPPAMIPAEPVPAPPVESVPREF